MVQSLFLVLLMRVYGYGALHRSLIFEKKTEKNKNNTGKPKSASYTRTRIDALCLGDMYGHTESVNQLLAFTETSFASCGSDNIVILWKDGRIESESRNRYAAFLMHQQLLELEKQNEMEESKSLDANDNSYEDDIDDNQSSGANSFKSMDSETTPKKMFESPGFNSNGTEYMPAKNVYIPEYIYDSVERLRNEKNYTIQEISEYLRNEANSESIVSAIAQKLVETSQQGAT